jgi:tetratricopeptide (TPR) repeat protein
MLLLRLPMPISQTFSIPNNDDEFEAICLELLREFWARPQLALFGKRGERQFGVDILDLSGETPIYAAQCKLKEAQKSFPPGEIQAEVDKAKQFRPPLGKYALLTTGKVSADSQLRIRDINQQHKQDGLFEVELFTWDRICDLLRTYSKVQEKFYGEIATGRGARLEEGLADIKGVMKDGFQSLTSKETGSQIDDQIDEARNSLDTGQFQLATLLLNRIQRVHAEALTPRQRFRVLTNHGAAALGAGDPEKAAKYFLEALAYQPEDEKAQVNEVFAYFLVGDISTSHAIATSLRPRYPASTRLAALWLSTAPKEISLESLEHEVNSILRKDAEVCLALARRALLGRAFEKALTYTQTAIVSAPKWSQPHLVLAQIGSGRAFFADFRSSGSAEQVLEEAEAACSTALVLARDENDLQAQLSAHILRAEVRLLLKKESAAVEDVQDAERLDPKDAGVLLTLGEVQSARGKTDEGISTFRKAFGLYERPDVAFVYARALRKRSRESDLDEALRVLLRMPMQEIPEAVRPSFAMEVVQCFVRKADWPKAAAYIQESTPAITPILSKVLQAHLAFYQGHLAEAATLAQESAALVSADTETDTKEFLARLFMLIGKPAEALPLWRDAFEAGRHGFDSGDYLNCAAALHRDDLVIEACARLHERGVNTWDLLAFELPYLTKYDIEAAIQRLEVFLSEHPKHKLAKLRLSLIGIGLGRAHLVRGALEDLPDPNELPLPYAIRAVGILRFGGNPNVAVDYAYRLLRGHFYDVEAHRALIASLMPGTSSPDIPPLLDVVGPHAAVCYMELPDGHPRWAVLESTSQPSADFEEVALDSPLATELLGKKAGDTVILAKGQIQDRTATIIQIMPKYVRRFQDSLQQMQIRFGSASALESVRVDVSARDINASGLKPFLDSIEKRATAIAEVQDLYQRNPVPLHLYGTRFGRNAFLALADLAQADNVTVKCCLGTAEERDGALRALESAKAVVVDLSALCTLRLLGLSKVLASTKYKFVVAAGTIITLREMLTESLLLSGAGGSLSYTDGKHVMYQTTAEDKEKARRGDEDFVQFIEKTVEIRKGTGLAALAPEQRDTLEKLFGRYGAESLILASPPDHILWTDDLIQAHVSAQEFGTRRAWTQVVLGTLSDAGLLTAEEYRDASAHLVGMQYVATLFDGSSALASFRLAGWSPENYPAKQMLNVFAEIPRDNLIGIYADVVQRLYREAFSAETKCSITFALLDAFAVKHGTESELVLLKRSLARVFGLNVIGAKQFNACFERWATGRSSRLIVIPR